MQLEVSVDRREGHVVVHLHGDLDVATAPRVRAALLEAQALDGGGNVVVDCAELDFLDSTGLGILIAARTRSRAAGGSLLLTGVRPSLERLLAVTGVDRLFRLDPQRPPAVAAG